MYMESRIGKWREKTKSSRLAGYVAVSIENVQILSIHHIYSLATNIGRNVIRSHVDKTLPIGFDSARLGKKLKRSQCDSRDQTDRCRVN